MKKSMMKITKKLKANKYYDKMCFTNSKLDELFYWFLLEQQHLIIICFLKLLENKIKVGFSLN